MLYLEELLDAVIAEEGQTLMGLEFLIDTLGLSMSKIDTLFKRTPEQHKGKRITVFSTPKLVQVLHREHILEEGVNVKSLLSVGTDGNISVLCTRIYDIRAGIISFDSKELADLIVHPNGINIIF